MDPRINVFVDGLNFGLHSIVLFMLAFYRSVQNFEEKLKRYTLTFSRVSCLMLRLRRRKTIQFWAFGLYGLLTTGQILCMLIAVRSTGHISTFVRFRD